MCLDGESTVLRINGLSDQEGRYFLDDPAREVTDLFHSSSPGVWIGQGASQFHLSGEVDSNDFTSVLNGRPPRSTLVPRHRRRRVGYDAIFAAPKCVSVLFSSSDHDQARAVVNVHHEALEMALGYLEQRALGIQRTDAVSKERHVLGIQGVTAARFTHGISRSGDPHLHSHVVIANLAHGDDGRFGAIDTRGFLSHRRAADALYRTHLRFGLTRDLGVHFQHRVDGREEISGVSDAETLALSGRSAEIRSGSRTFPEKTRASRHDIEYLWEQRRKMRSEIDDQPRFRSSSRHLDEHHYAAVISRESPTPRLVVEAWANGARAGMHVGVVARVLRRFDIPMGRGVYEPSLLKRQVSESRSIHRVLGPRPVEQARLDAWWDQRDRLMERFIREPRLRRNEQPALSFDRQQVIARARRDGPERVGSSRDALWRQERSHG